MTETFVTSTRQINVDPVSHAALRLELLLGNKAVIGAVATGFLWTINDSEFLVTNWHCLTGTNPKTGESLSSNGGRPTKVRIHWPTGVPGTYQLSDVDLYDSNGAARWRVFPKARENVDIAALEVERPKFPWNAPIKPAPSDIIMAQSINNLRLWTGPQRIGDPLFVIGYPKGLSAGGLPVWKRATIASEPEMTYDRPGQREILIDTAGRQGMSGAPIFYVSPDAPADRSVQDSNGRRVGVALGAGRVTIFAGIYCGRVQGKDELDAQIGRMHPIWAVQKVVAEGELDHFELHGAFEPTIEYIA